MPSEVTDYLRIAGFPSRISVLDAASKLVSWNLPKIVEFCLAVSERLPRKKEKRNSIFSFIGNNTLGGFPSPCSEPSCRLANVDSIARFAALYADEVMLPDAFSLIHDNLDSDESIGARTYVDIATHIRIIHDLEPLIDSGILTFAETVHHHLCIGCYARAMGEIENTFSDKLSLLKKLVTDRFLSDAAVFAEKEGDLVSYHINVPESLGPHGGFVRADCTIPRGLMKIAESTRTRLTRRQVTSYHVLDGNISEVIDDIIR